MDKVKKDKILIFGVSGALGRGLCDFLTKTYDIIGVCKSVDRAADLPIVDIFEMSSLTPEHLRQLLASISNEGENIVAIINCARNLSLLKCDDDIDRNFENFSCYLDEELLFNHALSVLAPPKLPNLRSICLVSSIYGQLVPNPILKQVTGATYVPQYGVSKAGIEYLIKDAAVRLMAHGININAVALGGIKGRANVSFENAYRDLNTVSEMLEIEECYGIFKFLVSEGSSAITGQTITVDKGFSLC